MLLIKEESQTVDAFQTALKNLESKNSVTTFKNSKLCIKHLKERAGLTSSILFFNLNDDGCKCLNEIVSIRNDKQNKNLSIVVYDPKAVLCDEDTFIAGANIYIKKSSDATELKKVIKKVLDMDWYCKSGKFNQETFFVSV
ncbi:hypothetical protein ACEN2I_02270 [Flavobacterium sp. W22_SRS_FK3]|uniref:hypothetical protein n=1 Tax=Flavobacterium sp. W22_SRS_FK3 TaxID=3240275 RepID=UPI003F906271